MATKIKVLHVVHWPKSGIVSFLYNFLKASKSDRMEYHIVFFIEDLEPRDDFSQICASVRYLDYENDRLKSIIRLKRIIDQIEPHIIHTHSYQPGIWSRLFSIGKKTIVVSTIHSPYPYLHGTNLKEKLKKVTETITVNLFNHRLICDSDAIKKHLMQHTAIHPNKLCVVKIGIDIEEKQYEAKKLEALKESIRITDSSVIISVGRISEEKGYDNLLRGFALLLENLQKCTLIVIGQGNLIGPLKELSSKLHIEHKTRFLGFVDDVFPYLAISSVYVCSSRYEGLPVSILEAIMMKLPVVATEVGGIPEIIENNSTGLLVEPDKPHLLGQAILQILTSERKRDRMVRESYRKLRNEFDIKIVVRKMESMYLHLLQEAGTGRHEKQA